MNIKTLSQYPLLIGELLARSDKRRLKKQRRRKFWARFGIKLSIPLFCLLLATKSLASWGNELPGQWQQGKCMTFAAAYAEHNAGTKLIVMVKLPLAHLVVMMPDGAFADNMHPVPRHSRNLMTWYYENGYESR